MRAQLEEMCAALSKKIEEKLESIRSELEEPKRDPKG
mgnify:CR=1 FL=1